ncbi:MAG: hypothetical protein EB078_06455 [Proteobacteria bacterium]|nr:hypothetical protein [Pseudomonadota bacterium]NDC24611.1 hypothetical protein [Pseudomonadota bacterium]NDD04528.1 hypothetical protein [Pseudomonadota bacterium]NDG27213.1 hypothetical protein [Pseudomonadota bacterium]
MPSDFLKKQPSKSRASERRILDIEEFDNYDHWMRDCRVRSDAWFTVETWARENGFHMVAYKAKKRLYQKGMVPDSFISFLEVRHEEGRVVLKSWIQVSTKMRWLTLFKLPNELKIDPSGFWAVRVRRRACHEINDLLVRLKQPEIANSHLFHWADFALTTLFLLALFPLPLVLFVLGLIGKIEISAGLSNSLLSLLGEKFSFLLGTGISLILIHHWVIIKQVRKNWANWTSFAISSLVFSVLSIFLLTRTGREMLDQKIVFYCVSHYNEQKCNKGFNSLSASEREYFSKRLDSFQKQLAIKKE